MSYTDVVGINRRRRRGKFLEALERRTLLTAVAVGDVPAAEYASGITATSLHSSYPNVNVPDVAELNGSVYYLAPTSTGHVGLWKAGVAATLIKETDAPTGLGLVAAGTKLQFLTWAPNGPRWEIWTSNGTSGATVSNSPVINESYDTFHVSDFGVTAIGGIAYWGIPVTQISPNSHDRAVLAWSSVNGFQWSMMLSSVVDRDPTPFVKFGNDVYFTGNDGLYKSSGGTGSPTRIFSRDFLSAGDVNAKMVAGSTTLLFTGGAALFTYNGTTTQAISSLGLPSSMAWDGTTFYLGAEADSQTGVEFYRLDGSTPQLVADIWPDAGQSSSPQDITFAGGKIFFTANSAVGREVWESDGVTAHLVQDTWPGATSSSPDLIAYQNQAYFSAIDPVEGPSLHRIESNDSVTTIDPVAGDVGIDPQLRSGGTLLSFWGNDRAKGYGLFTYDGQAMQFAGDYNSATFSPSIPVAAGGSTLYLGTGDLTPEGNELYAYDGTSLSLLADISADPLASAPQGLAFVNGTLYFSARANSLGREPWIYNAAGASMLMDMYPGSNSSSPTDFHAFGNEVDFSAAIDSSSLRYFSVTDGTPAGTRSTSLTAIKVVPYYVAKAFTPNNSWQALVNQSSTALRRYFQSGSSIFSTGFGNSAAGDNVAAPGDDLGFYNLNGQPWVAGGSPYINFQLTTISGSGLRSYGFNETNNKVIYVTGSTSGADYGGVSVRATDLVSKTTELLFSGVTTSPIFADNGTFYFGARVNGAYHLYRSQGTAATTVSIADFQDLPRNFIKVGGHIYFVASGSSGAELYTTDGTPEGTLLVADVNPGAGSSEPNNLVNVNGTLMFTANDGVSVKLFKLVAPAVPLHTLGASFDPNGPEIDVRFTDQLIVDPSDLKVTNQTTGESVSPVSAVVDSQTWVGTWSLPADAQVLKDGNYQATLDPADVSDAFGNHPSEGVSIDFFVLSGDANHDRTVDTNDFTLLAQNFNQPGATFSHGDFNYEGVVNALDFNILATQFGTTLAPPADAAPLAVQGARGVGGAVASPSSPASLFADKPLNDDDLAGGVIL